MALIDEIREQPSVASRLLRDGREPIIRVAADIRGRFDSVVIAARGSSDHAAMYAQYLLGTAHGLPVALAAPSLLTVYHRTPVFRRVLVIGISQSGAAPDVCAVVAAAHEQGMPTIAITNTIASPLSALAEHVIDLMAGPETAVAATKTYTASLLAIAMLSASLGGSSRWSELDQLPAVMDANLATTNDLHGLAGRFASIEHCIVLGRGFGYVTACEWALKLQELTHVVAHAFSASDFRHGPIALVGERFPVLVTASGGAAGDDAAALARELESGLRAKVLAATSRDDLRPSGGTIHFAEAESEAVTHIAAIIPLQLFAAELARARGLDPDAPRHLSKVTQTR